MAIAEALPGLRVTVEVDGGALTEYPVHNKIDEPTHVVRYIEAATNKRFAIKRIIPKGFRAAGEGLYCQCIVDGDILAGSMMEWSSCHDKGLMRIYEGYEATQTLLRPFTFGFIETASDRHQTNEEALLVERLGTVCVVVFCIKNIRFCEKPAPLLKAPEDVGIISAKALKGNTLSHNVVLEKPIENVRSEISWAFKWLTVDRENLPVPAAKFEFRYRSLDALKSLLIIPRTPSPTPLEEREFDSLSREELVELQKRARAAKEKNDLAMRVKREPRDDKSRPRKGRPRTTGRTLLEMDEAGSFREILYPDSPQREVEVAELD